MSYFKSGVIVALFTLLSRIFGLIRELVIANFFGTNLFADALNTAFKFPNLFRRIFGEGALSSVFIPIYAEKLQKNKKEAIDFSSEIYTILTIFLTILCAILVIYMPYVIHLLAPGFISDGVKFEIAVLLTRITMPYMVFISLAALIGAIHHSHNRFGIFAFMPVILNITVIISCFIDGDNYEKPVYVAYGILAGGVCQFLFMKFTSRIFKIEYNFISIKKISKSGIRMLKNMIPAALGSSVTQLNLFISMTIASFAPGAISILSYADRIYQFPLSIIGICFGTILLPALSKEYSIKNYDKALDIQTKAIKLALFLSIASSAGIIVLSHNIIHVIYERGHFTSQDTIDTSQTIMIFALGLPSFILNKVLTPVFYANKDAITPFRITVVTIIINITANLILIWKYQHLGIAMGTVLAAWFNIAITIYFLKNKKFDISKDPPFLFIIKLLAAAFVMSLFIYEIEFLFSEQFYQGSTLMKFISLLLVIIIGGSIYLLSCLALKIIKVKDLKLLVSR